jgi:4-alpha-glucanotransferase
VQAVAGVPPDYFSADGQLWGNPLYDWRAMQLDGFSWWLTRLATQLERFDLLRIDHFRGLESYWEIPARAASAREGAWQPAAGAALLERMREELPHLPLVAEDLGVITEPVKRLRLELGLPGMAVLQFGFTPSERHTQHVFANHVEHQVVYTGTHDNDTIRGWFEALPDAERALLDEELERCGIADPEPHWALVRLAFASRARVAMVQLQDVLGLSSEGRMNQPGSVGGWGWKLDELPSLELAKRLRERTEEAGRL